ncbi:MAG: 4Fe-4S dicluster domain-containing protein [Thermodesulfobacteriota bacterium]
MGKDLASSIRGLMEKNRLNFCLECGKCSAVCPMVEFYGEYVPDRCTRNIVERLSFDPEALWDETLWYCWACQECTFFCPSGVDFQNFMIGFRNLLISHGVREHAYFCAACGSYLMPKRQADVLKGNLNGARELLEDCPTCKRQRFVNAFVHVSAKGRSYPL